MLYPCHVHMVKYSKNYLFTFNMHKELLQKVKITAGVDKKNEFW